MGRVGTPRRQPVPPAPRVPAPLPGAARRRAARRRGRPSRPRARCSRTGWRRCPPRSPAASGPDDVRFDQITGRRPMVEATFARLAAREPGVEIRRGVVVRGLSATAPNGTVPHVHRRCHRRRRAHRRRPRRRRRRTPVRPARLARRHRRPPSRRGDRRLRVRLLRPPLPLGRRRDAADVRAAAAGLRLGVVVHRRRRQRQLVGRAARQRQGPGAAWSPRRGDLGADRPQLSADRPLDRRRAGHRVST